MAAELKNTGTLIFWVSPEFTSEIRELSDRDGRSVSNLIKVAMRDRLSETSPDRESPARGGIGGLHGPAERAGH